MKHSMALFAYYIKNRKPATKRFGFSSRGGVGAVWPLDVPANGNHLLAHFLDELGTEIGQHVLPQLAGIGHHHRVGEHDRVPDPVFFRELLVPEAVQEAPRRAGHVVASNALQDLCGPRGPIILEQSHVEGSGSLNHFAQVGLLLARDDPELEGVDPSIPDSIGIVREGDQRYAIHAEPLQSACNMRVTLHREIFPERTNHDVRLRVLLINKYIISLICIFVNVSNTQKNALFKGVFWF